MKKNSIYWLVTFLFIVASALAVYQLYQFPNALTQYSAAIDLGVVEKLQPLLWTINIIVGAALMLGLGAATLLILSSNTSTSTRQLSDLASAQVTENESGNLDETKTEEEVLLGDIDELLTPESLPKDVFSKALSKICQNINASQAAAFKVITEDEYLAIELFATFAYHIPEGERTVYRFGEGIAGQVAKEGTTASIEAVPEGYIQILSGLGKATPGYLVVVPLKDDTDVLGVVEVASFAPFTKAQISALESYFGRLALKVLNNDNVRLADAKQ